MDYESQVSDFRAVLFGFGGDLEARFRGEYFRSSLRQVRTGLALAFFLIAVHGYLDVVSVPDHVARLWVIRFGFCCPVVLAGFLLTLPAMFERVMQPAIATTAVLAGLGYVGMTLVAPAPENYQHFSGVFLIMAASYTFIRLRFLYASVAAWVITGAYISAHLILKNEPGLSILGPITVLVNTNIIGMMTVYMLEIYQRRNFLQQQLLEKRNVEIRNQQQLAENLLLDILPAEVAEELKTKGVVSPRYFEDVTILFTDFQGFTAATEDLSAGELVEILHGYFSAFDEVARKYDLEKLKTIGDSYMCVGGLPTRNGSHAVDAVLAGFEIIEQVACLNARFGLNWRIRVGLHTGPVVSGVVGVRKFAFDIWGASVNFASRMESSGSPGRVNVSPGTAARIRDFFVCISRGMVGTKDRRDFEMYFVDGPIRKLVEGCASGLPSQFAARYRNYFGKDLQEFPATLLPVPGDAAPDGGRSI